MIAVRLTAVFGKGADLRGVVEAYAAERFSGFAVSGVGYSEQFGVEPVVKFTTIAKDEPKDAERFITVSARIGSRFGEKEVLAYIAGSGDTAMLISTSETDGRGLARVKHPLHDSFPICPDCGERHPSKEKLLRQFSPGGSNPLLQLIKTLGQRGYPQDEREDGNVIPFGLPGLKKPPRREDN